MSNVKYPCYTVVTLPKRIFQTHDDKAVRPMVNCEYRKPCCLHMTPKLEVMLKLYLLPWDESTHIYIHISCYN